MRLDKSAEVAMSNVKREKWTKEMLGLCGYFGDCIKILRAKR